MTPPTRYALVPVEATEEMIEAFYEGAHAAKEAALSNQTFPYGIAPLEWFPAGYAAMLAASPNAGCVTAEMRLAAYDAGMAALKRRKRPMIPSGDMIAIVTAAFKSAGLDLEDFLKVDALAGEVVDG